MSIRCFSRVEWADWLSEIKWRKIAENHTVRNAGILDRVEWVEMLPCRKERWRWMRKCCWSKNIIWYMKTTHGILTVKTSTTAVKGSAFKLPRFIYLRNIWWSSDAPCCCSFMVNALFSFYLISFFFLINQTRWLENVLNLCYNQNKWWIKYNDKRRKYLMKPNSPIMRYLLQNNLVDDFVPYGVYMRYVAGLSFLIQPRWWYKGGAWAMLQRKPHG